MYLTVWLNGYICLLPLSPNKNEMYTMQYTFFLYSCVKTVVHANRTFMYRHQPPLYNSNRFNVKWLVLTALCSVATTAGFSSNDPQVKRNAATIILLYSFYASPQEHRRAIDTRDGLLEKGSSDTKRPLAITCVCSP